MLQHRFFFENDSMNYTEVLEQTAIVAESLIDQIQRGEIDADYLIELLQEAAQ
jgi:hypothetical protein